MDLAAIISAAAGEADDFLAGVRTMTEARPLIRDYLKANHPELEGLDAQRAIAGVLAILEDEEFFAVTERGDSWDDGETAAPG